jgi:hypothetical protein
MQEADGFGIYILDTCTHEVRRVTDGIFPVWLNVHTLTVVR